MPNGAATTAVRNIVYFQAHATTSPVLVLLGYAIGGSVVALAVPARRHRRRGVVSEPAPPVALATAS